MREERHESAGERIERLALAVHRLADRFSLQDEMLGKRLRDTTTALIEDIALHEYSRTHDAAGATMLLHRIVGRLEALKALLLFVKGRRAYLSPQASDILLAHVEKLGEEFRAEDREVEAHIARLHPRGGIVAGTFEPSQKEAPLPEGSPLPFDPLLGPDAMLLSQGKNSLSAPEPQRSVIAAATTSQTKGGNGALRKKRILDFFTLRRHAQLKDVLALFPGTSEKTIRNDLAELCRSGQLRRVGLAPRSRYILSA